ncbi:hypothetical protein [Paraburkholderia mimosarum]|uniref:hypothetical protein n=1 Tax=Paraburkholderia mimosarum TaxID=312026 RepID=UPI0012B54039|nr:hypothetical protein [Paraburkholderia mimosarum]
MAKVVVARALGVKVVTAMGRMAAMAAGTAGTAGTAETAETAEKVRIRKTTPGITVSRGHHTQRSARAESAIGLD